MEGFKSGKIWEIKFGVIVVPLLSDFLFNRNISCHIPLSVLTYQHYISFRSNRNIVYKDLTLNSEIAQPVFSCSKSLIETPECVKSVHS